MSREKNLFLSGTDQKTVRVKTEAFTGAIERRYGATPALSAALKKISTLPQHREDLHDEVRKACLKTSGYFARLFSDESWSEWTERRTALGRVIAVFQEHLETTTNVGVLVKRLDESVVRQAEKEAGLVLRRLEGLWEGQSYLSQDASCKRNLVLGALGLVVTQNPIPFLFGLGGCLPVGKAQIPIGKMINIQAGLVPYNTVPAIATLSNGNFVVAWISCTSSCQPNYSLVSQMYNATGSTIGGNFNISTCTSNALPAIATLTNDIFVVAWVSCGFGCQSYSALVGQMYDTTGSPIGENFNIATYSFINSPAIAVFGNGNFVIAWVGCPSGCLSSLLTAQIYNPTGSPIGGNFSVATYSSWIDAPPAIATLSNGNFVIAWTCLMSEVLGQMFNANGSMIGENFIVSTYPTLTAPAIAALSTGNFVIAWINNTSPDVAQAQMYNATGSMIGENFINTYSYGIVPTIAALRNGSFVVVLSNWAADGYGEAVVQIYNATRSPINENSYINTESLLIVPTIAVFSNGNFVVVFTSSNLTDCSPENQIFAQIFSNTSNINFNLTIANNGQINPSSASATASSTGVASILSSSLSSSGSSSTNPSTMGSSPSTTASSTASSRAISSSSSTATSSTGIRSTTSSLVTSSSARSSRPATFTLPPSSTATSSTGPQTTSPSTTNPTTAIAIIASIGGIAVAILGSRVLITYMNRRNLRNALSNITRADKIQAQFYREVVQPITIRTFAKINTTNPIGYRSKDKATAYLRATSRVVQRIEKNIAHLNLIDAEKSQQETLFAQIADEIKNATASSGCPRPRVTPLQIEDAAAAIASGVKTTFVTYRPPDMELGTRA